MRRWTEGPLAGDLIERSMIMPKSAVTMLSNWTPWACAGTGKQQLRSDRPLRSRKLRRHP
jgi:hypothetical protein